MRSRASFGTIWTRTERAGATGMEALEVALCRVSILLFWIWMGLVFYDSLIKNIPSSITRDVAMRKKELFGMGNVKDVYEI